jgi:hypothetical protein
LGKSALASRHSTLNNYQKKKAIAIDIIHLNHDKRSNSKLALHDIGPKSFQRFSKTASFARTSKKMGFWTEANILFLTFGLRQTDGIKCIYLPNGPYSRNHSAMKINIR